MSTQVQLRRGSTTEHNSFTGAAGEVTVDTTKKTLVVHDGSTAGGVPLAKESALSSYLTTATAASTYQTQAGMSSYLTTTAAGTTYAPLASPTFTGTVTIPAGASISGYLTTATAASTYLATSAVGSTVQAYNANTAVTNAAQSFTAAQRGAVTALTDGATVTPDFSLSNNWSLTLGGSRTLANPTNLTAGQTGVIVITNGAYTLSFGGYWKFPGGTAPTLTQNGVDVLAYYVDSSTRITARLIADVK